MKALVAFFLAGLALGLAAASAEDPTTTPKPNHIEIEPRALGDDESPVEIEPREEEEELDRITNTNLYNLACGAHVYLRPGDSYVVQSPNYPANYPDNADCNRRFSVTGNTRPRIVCDDFDTECGWFGADPDLLSITSNFGNRGTYCDTWFRGRTVNWSWRSYDTTLDMNFHSGLFGNRKGFRCRVYGDSMGPQAPLPQPPYSCNCGIANNNGLSEDRIVGGYDVKPHQFPWTVGLMKPGETQPFCGGTIVSREWIITAAHCVEGLTDISFMVQVGEHDITKIGSNDRQIPVRRIVTHRKYVKNVAEGLLIYDFAMVKLSKPLDFNNPYTRPVCLPRNNNNKYEGQTARAMGWGETQHGTGNRESDLKQFFPTIYPMGQCGNFDTSDTQIRNQHICAYTAGKDTCQGDSGGPLVVLDSGNKNCYTLVGVTSFGFLCAVNGYPGVYGRVSEVIRWIDAIAGSQICYP